MEEELRAIFRCGQVNGVGVSGAFVERENSIWTHQLRCAGCGSGKRVLLICSPSTGR